MEEIMHVHWGMNVALILKLYQLGMLG